MQKMAQYASFCLIMGPFKGEVPVFARLWPVRPLWRVPRRRLVLAGLEIRVRVKVTGSFLTGALWPAILATAGLLVVVTALDFCIKYVAVIFLNCLNGYAYSDAVLRGRRREGESMPQVRG